MPAIITHRIFGEKAMGLLDEARGWDEEKTRAFLLGNQGPDPFAARFRATRESRARCHDFGRAMQDSQATAAFLALHEGMSRLPDKDVPVARAFVLGLTCHYMLDRTAHPMIISQELALAEQEPELGESRREVHALIEAELDSWMLLKDQGIDPDGEAAASLGRTERICQVAGTLLAHVARTVFDIALETTDYAQCVADYEVIYNLIEPRDSAKAQAAFTFERRAFGSGLLPQLSHVPCDGTCWAANEGRHPWEHPYLGHEQTDSFYDLFDKALADWPEFALAVAGGDETAVRGLVGGLNYAGQPGRD